MPAGVVQAMRWLPVLLSTMLLFQAVAGAPDEAIGRVVSVISGDSIGIEVLVPDQRARPIDSVKLADVVSPSTVFPEGKVAREFSNSMLKNKTVFLDIDEKIPGGRNEWGQLICVLYLMDSKSRPVWPCFNRILVENKYAEIEDDKNNEFNASSWWGERPAMQTETRARFLKDANVSARSAGSELGVPFPVVTDPNSTSVLKRSPGSGTISIGYR